MNKNIKVKNLKEQSDNRTPQDKFLLTIFGAIAEFEKELKYSLQKRQENIKDCTKKRLKDFDYYKQAYING